MCDSIKKIEEALSDIKNGKMVILVDDEDRENEGDLVMAAEHVTPEAVNFMAKYGRGLICLSLSREICDRLDLPLMVSYNSAQFQTAFTVSIEAKEGVTTGISAADRATTILTAINPESTPDDITRPGHIFPLRGRDGGVFERRGQTEGSIDLSKLAGLSEAGVICEIMNDDGTMARMPELEIFAEEHKLKIISVEDIVKYRTIKEGTLKRTESAELPADMGNFKIIGFRSKITNEEAVALVCGEPEKSDEPVLVRVHSQCLTGDVFGSKRCDCGDQLEESMQMISDKSCGVIVYLFQEGRGIGILNKIAAYCLQDIGYDTVDANTALGFEPDSREYDLSAGILKDIGVSSIKLITNNPEKEEALSRCGIDVVETVPVDMFVNDSNYEYMATKKYRMNHKINVIGSEFLAYNSNI